MGDAASEERDDDIVVYFGPPEAQKISAGRRIAARGYIERALCKAGKLAIDFQSALLEDENADPSLRFKASEAVLDRLMGKAAQEIRVEDVTERPLVFDPKLQALRGAMQEAIDAHKRNLDMEETFARAVTRQLVDEDGVTI